MRNQGQISPDHAAILATLSRSTAAPPSAVRAGTVVRTSGVSRPGPDGPLVAPLSGRPCVWFRVLEWRFPPVMPIGGGLSTPPVLHSILTSDMGLGMPVDSLESPQPFAVADGDGEVLVDPRNADVDAPTVSFDGTEGDYGLTTYTLKREWVLSPGEPVFALGPVFDDGRPVLRAGTVDGLVVSGRGEAGAVNRSRSFVAAQAHTPLAGIRLPSTVTIMVVVAVFVIALALIGAFVVA